jgi:hypothetical protein
VSPECRLCGSGCSLASLDVSLVGLGTSGASGCPPECLLVDSWLLPGYLLGGSW